MAKAKKTEDKTPKAPAKAAAKSAVKKPVAKPVAAKATSGLRATKPATPKTASVKAKAATATAKAPRASAATAVKEAPAKSRKPAAKAAVAESKVSEVKSRGSAAASKLDAAALRTLDKEDVELPQEYGDTKVVLLNRDPEWIFAYWEVNRATRKRFGIERGTHNKQFVLRLHELRLDNGKTTPTDTAVNDYTSSWYLRIPNTASRYMVELGVYGEKNKFISITTSNPIEIPRMSISEETDVEFAEINDEIYGQIVHLSGGRHFREKVEGDDFVHSLQQRVIETLSHGPLSSGANSFFGHSSFGLSSGSLSSSSLTSSIFTAMGPGAGGEGALSRPKGKGDFWLEVGVDVIVYGATEPDAKVKFMGQEVKLTPDGTFRMRMVFPDTTIEFPVEATSADGKHKRGVKPIVKRHTEGSPHKPLK
ncbi:hypothetical protein BH09SUM1_BH09SUM1_28140 [soil metagenome]